MLVTHTARLGMLPLLDRYVGPVCMPNSEPRSTQAKVPEDPCMLQLWFAKVLRDGLALAASESFAPFKDVGAFHLRSMLKAAGFSGDHEQAVQTVLGGFNDATCMPDVGPAFKKLHAAGIKVIKMLIMYV